MAAKYFVASLCVCACLFLPGCSDKSSTGGDNEPVIIATPYEDLLEAGKWVICWVPDPLGFNSGSFTAKVTAGDYTASHEFAIDATAPEVPSLYCGGTSAPGIPSVYASFLTSAEYAIGDTVNVVVEVHAATQVEVDILK
jgi:hypothetical protein